MGNSLKPNLLTQKAGTLIDIRAVQGYSQGHSFQGHPLRNTKQSAAD